MKAKLSLLPIFTFLAIFIGVGSYLHAQGVDYAFYQFPAPVAIIPALILAVILGGKDLTSTLDTLVRGAGNKDIISMCLIYLLAGAFAVVSKASGGVDSTVNFGLSIIPLQFIIPGLFVIAAFVSTAMGTSMGTIAAISPIAYALGEKTGIDMSLLAGVVLGGSMFGDNLSIISDTTIAATRSQGCAMKDKFRENIYIALPAAIITILFLFTIPVENLSLKIEDYHFIKIAPYLAILILALLGINVFVVLMTGVLFAGIVAMSGVKDYSYLKFSQDIFEGFKSMQEIFLLSMFIGALSAIVKSQGGMKVLLYPIEKAIIKASAKKGPLSNLVKEFGVSIMVSIVDICTANNTVAIIVTGPLAREIVDNHGLSPRRSASLMDVFSCVFQGLIPYGAQALLVASSFKLSPFEVTATAYYCWVLAFVAVVNIIYVSYRKSASF